MELEVIQFAAAETVLNRLFEAILASKEGPFPNHIRRLFHDHLHAYANGMTPKDSLDLEAKQKPSLRKLPEEIVAKLERNENVQQWEYEVKGLGHDVYYVELQKMGEAGWELCTVINSVSSALYFFKRPKL